MNEENITMRQELGEEIDHDILKAIHENPTASTRELAKVTGYSQSTIYRHLSKNLEYKFRPIQHTPHSMDANQQQKRVAIAKRLLPLVEAAALNAFEYFYTGDESWFFYENQKKYIWVPKCEDPPIFPKRDMLDKKIMICIFWNPNDILILDATNRGEAICAQSFKEHILIPMTNTAQFLQSQMDHKQFTIHMDNAPAHRAKVVTEFLKDTGIAVAPHPPFSPDLAPSDFYLFGKLKSQLGFMEFSSKDEIIQWIRAQFLSIDKQELEAAFLEWIYRLRACIRYNGQYITK